MVTAAENAAAPRFSILIAAWNAACFLPECLASLRAQTLADYEVLCVDDASTDATAEILDAAARADGRLRVWHLAHNGGQAAARNVALAEARGAYTLMVDADDRLAPDALALLDAALSAEHDADAAVLRLVCFDDGGTETEVPVRTGRRSLSGREACLLSIDLSLHGLYALRTDLFQAHPYPEQPRRYADDTITPVHYALCRRVVLTRATYFYRRHAASCTAALFPEKLDFIAANALLRAHIEGMGFGSAARQRCEAYIWANYVSLYRRYLMTRHGLSPEVRRMCRSAFRTAHAAMRPLRLSRRLWMQPSTFFVPTFPLFALWQRLLWAAKGRPRE